MDKEALQKLMSMGGKLPNPGAAGGPLVKLVGVTAGLGLGMYGLYNSLFTVENGQRAIIFNKFGKNRNSTLPIPDKGIDQMTVLTEGTHIAIPWFQKPIIYNIKTRPWTADSRTGSMDLQMVDISIRVLTKPMLELDPTCDYDNEYPAGFPLLPQIYDELGDDKDMERRVLPSIVPEILKEVIARHNATHLINNRHQVSVEVTEKLRAIAKKFHLSVEDVSLTQISFGQEYARAVESKQVAIQEAERARYVVDRATQEAKSIIVAAEGEAESAALLNQAMEGNPQYLELKRIQASIEIAETISKSANRVYMNTDNLLMGLGEEASKALLKAKK